MNQARLFKLLWKGLFLTFLLSTILTIILTQIVFRNEAQNFVSGQEIPLFFTSSVIWNLALTISASTAFFNLYPAVRNSAYYCFLSFFILPSLIALYIGLKIEDMAKVFFTLTIPFFVVQTWVFIKFRMTNFNAE